MGVPCSWILGYDCHFGVIPLHSLRQQPAVLLSSQARLRRHYDWYEQVSTLSTEVITRGQP